MYPKLASECKTLGNSQHQDAAYTCELLYSNKSMDPYFQYTSVSTYPVVPSLHINNFLEPTFLVYNLPTRDFLIQSLLLFLLHPRTPTRDFLIPITIQARESVKE